MISLEGLTLATGRHAEAGYILRTFAHYVRDGLIPNMFPEGENEGLYHTADATLWFFHAIDRYLDGHRRPRRRSRLLLPKLHRHRRAPPRGHAVRHRRRSRRRPARARAPRATSSPGWTPRSTTGSSRRGAARRSRSTRSGTTRCACSSAGCARSGDDGGADASAEHAERARRVVQRALLVRGGRLPLRRRRRRARRRPGAAGRTSSSPSRSTIPVLDAARWEPVVDVVRERLLTPVGLRSLAPGHPDYKPQLLRRPARARRRLSPGHRLGVADRAVHRRLAARSTPTTAPARAGSSTASSPHLDEACVGSISEIFDAESPYTPRGCVAQAWSVAEVLRCWVRTSPLSEASGTREIRAVERRSLASHVPAGSVRHRRFRPGGPTVRRLPRRRRPDVLADHAPHAPGLRWLALRLDVRLRG